MATKKIESSSLTKHVARTWITCIGLAHDPFRFPDVRHMEPGELPILFGRDDGYLPNAYLVEDASMSGRHAELRYRDMRFELVDLGSTNGTFINGFLLHRDEPHPLRDGDVMQLGSTFFRFRSGLFDEVCVPKPPTEDNRLTSVCPEFIDAVIALRTACLNDAPVLIQGETGTGKEIFAKTLHQMSGRPGKYVGINTAAIQPTLIQAELFGVVRGAHSKADEARDGLIRSAERGTVLLDEIGDMPLEIQPALLRMLQEKRVYPVGSDDSAPIDVRVLAATHRDPDDDRILRPDLIARLRGISIVIPSLRERIEDLGLLTARILREIGANNSLTFAADAYARLCFSDWPENVRHLAYVLRHAALLSTNGIVTVDALDASGLGRPRRIANNNSDGTIMTPEYARTLLREYSGVVKRAAKAVGWDRMKFSRYIEREGIDPDLYRPRPVRSPIRDVSTGGGTR